MNLFAGLEKFGIKADNTTDLFEDEKSRQHPLMVEKQRLLRQRTVFC